VSDTGWVEVASQGVRLAARRFDGPGEAVVLLHGLAGHNGEWTQLANVLTSTRDVVALDLRGHGCSERRPSDVSPQAFCSDVVEVIQAVGHEQVQLVGQSFGGHIAFLTAAWFPEVVSSLVVVEADPDGPKPEVLARVATSLRSWPRPFPSRASALAFFGSTASPETWVEGLDQREDGAWPRFDNDIVVAALKHFTDRSWWDEWKSITCPTVIVRGDDGDLPLSLSSKMASALPVASVMTIADAGHDVHLDQAERLARVVTGAWA
jgi:pimeloyl-ACP methyl ester carboxylesterase